MTSASRPQTTNMRPTILLSEPTNAAIASACARIAPTWPLDQFIAVNPYWGFVHHSIAETDQQLRRLSGTRLLMPRSYYREQYQAGTFERQHVQWALAQINSSKLDTHPDADALIAALNQADDQPKRLALVTDAVDAKRDLSHVMAWNDVVTHHISQHCAAYFDRNLATWSPDHKLGLYASWRDQALTDVGPSFLTGFKSWSEKIQQLPEDASQLIAWASNALGLPEQARAQYYCALLLSMNGWASWCAYERWQSKLAQQPEQDEANLMQLLAIRLAWEWVLYDRTLDWDVNAFANDAASQINEIQQHDWILQAAFERAQQEHFMQGLQNPPPAKLSTTERLLPHVQAVFCIDVRSEVFRRALEASNPYIQTKGFAGFFGLPIAFSPGGTAMVRPQLPGLLAPAQCATEVCDEPSLGQALLKRRKQLLGWKQVWQEFRTSPSSGFSFVEACGWWSGVKLVQKNLPQHRYTSPVEQAGLTTSQQAQLRPRLNQTQDPAEQTARSEMLIGILGAMGLTRDFSRLVLLAGHGSQTANNPHAAGLDCGACGGQTGEVNARVLAALLNDPTLRLAIKALGVTIPDSTYFLAGLHNTTTDEVMLYDVELLPNSHLADLQQLRTDLLKAGDIARTERAPSLGLKITDNHALRESIQARANDWSQVRPEWGLVNNAAFIVAPRHRSQHMNLQGRSFLHDYDWQQDSGAKVLELIMTAPMVVTHWINMQYHASTVDNRRYGSGNKVLHNVVGGRLGVFEGNGGDLRIGLPFQSLHDGKTLRHTPVRLSVFIEAPFTMLNAVIEKHVLVKQLLDGQWLHLFQIDAARKATQISRYQQGQWIIERSLVEKLDVQLSSI